ncbi:hypothetical protein HHL21_05250 [Massilia sp. RP-1-19]|uniref:FecR protein domain-containing protein n=1 Tax=Massilia polaris TaxID=2728846 RepID=A0A848HGC3_9BURK|nr:DUF6600 domain-containing protein [Massilia polaris]NML60505.1 hypothetical protein [Massilia polaris]
MRSPFMRVAAVLALMACSVLAQAQSEAPARVGRVSLVQGPVTISSEDGDQPEGALVNWPVTSDNRITTERNARTEIRIGSTAVRLDGDSSLEVLELDDDRLQLLLHYGSANIRVRNTEVLDGFSIETPQGRVRMREAGRIRIDADRDASVVDVFDGVALVDSDGSTISVRPGRRVEMRQGDLLTALAVRTSFDDWARLRDLQDDRVVSDRYVTTEMTGYEELDRYGSWSDNSEYGPVWLPRHVSAGWAPYRDGRWTWVSPWGWTWIDNAPWGYAPSHYGRWVMVNQRWGWAPGRHTGRPVWAPALVGWVGGSGWNLAFNSGSMHRSAPAQGWYPLGFGEHYTPGYRVKNDHLRYINRHARPHDGRRRNDDHRRHGLTVVPHDQFNRRAPIVVPSAPRGVVTPLALQNAPVAAPQRPSWSRGERVRRPRDGAVEADGVSYRVRRPVQAAPAPTVQPQVQAPVAAPVQVQPAPRREGRAGNDERREARGADDPRPRWGDERREQMEAARREQADAARRSQLDQMRQAQIEEARRGQADQMRRMQMDERRSQMDEMRRARQGQVQAAPAAVQQQPAPQQMPQAQPERRRIAPQPQVQAPAAAPAAQDVNPVVQQERRAREEPQQRRGNRPDLTQEH